MDKLYPPETSQRCLSQNGCKAMAEMATQYYLAHSPEVFDTPNVLFPDRFDTCRQVGNGVCIDTIEVQQVEE